MNNVYEKALDMYNTGLFLKLEGSFGRCFVDNFLNSGIIKTIDEADNKVIAGYNRKIMLKKAVIDQDRIEDLWLDNPDLIKAIEELWSGFPTLERR